MKQLIYIFGVVLSVACNDNKVCKITGNLSNLSNDTLYAVYESSENNRIDTIVCDERGQFSLYSELNDNLNAIAVYYSDRRQWFVIYPEANKSIKINGDARYPQLLQISGGRTNNKLSEFKKKASAAIKGKLNIDNELQSATIDNILRELVREFVSKNTDEEASAILISEYWMDVDNIEPAEELLGLLSSELQNNPHVAELKAHVAKIKTSITGASAPDFNVTNIDGVTFAPHSFADKYYILAFTALWCDLCQTDQMMLNEIAVKHSKDSIDILLISLDDDIEEIRDQLQSDTIRWNMVVDSAGQAIRLFDLYNVKLLPQCVLVDKKGIIRLRTTNGMELKQTIDELMN